MLDISQFESGTILWLPKLRDIIVVRFDTTVPNSCFGHPVLLLAVDSLNSSATILIVYTPPLSHCYNADPRNSSHLLAGLVIYIQKYTGEAMTFPATCP